MGASRLERAEPYGGHWDGSLPHCTLDFLLGACVGLEGGVHTWRLDTRLPMSVLSPTGSSQGQMTSSHVVTSTVTQLDAIEAASAP
jgi:hypothetical protein